ncbi:hypothetical protein Tco_0629307 [Tanacetum coccineum]|uniref:Uncharacterized protein n=1 Tax=Tanacetum coccineum TaxID=301880 RepID=A0ABQ4WSR7_9ASTR
MHEVIEEEWDRKEVDGFKWKHQWEAMMSSSFEGADNEVLTDAVTWRYFLITGNIPLESTSFSIALRSEARAKDLVKIVGIEVHFMEDNDNMIREI